MGSFFCLQYGIQILRHGLEHHPDYRFCRGNIVRQYPFLRHADRPHTIESNAVSELSIENIGTQLLFCEVRIALRKVFHHTFLTIDEAALQSGISPQAISRYAMRCHFGECRKIGGKIRIPGKHFQEWMKKRQEGEMAHGFN